MGPLNAHSPRSIVVVGAGIIGAVCALTLQREGHHVRLVDSGQPGMGCSFGNGGAISPDFCVPMSMPGMLKRVPKWLRDPLGPLFLDWKHIPRALPWLLRWVAAGRPSRVKEISQAMRALHAPALQMYQRLLGEHYDKLIQKTGQLYVWRNPTATASESIARELRESHGIAVKTLTAKDVYELDPALADGYVRGLFFADNAHTLDPLGLVNALIALFEQAGGQVLQSSVQAFTLANGQAVSAQSTGGDLEADLFVLATGLAATKFAAQLGDAIPMQGERGYHVMLPNPGVRPSAKVANRDQMFGMTPMTGGVRISGTVEITHPDTPPDMRRAKLLLENAKLMYPGLDGTGATFWAGSRPSTPDSLPVIDHSRNARNVIYAFGHGHSGLTGAPMTAQLVADLIAGRTPTITTTPFHRDRFQIAGRPKARKSSR